MWLPCDNTLYSTPAEADLGCQQCAQVVLVGVAVPPVVLAPLHVAPLDEDVCQLLVLPYDLCMVPSASA